MPAEAHDTDSTAALSASVHAVLAALPEPWLLIFGNVPDQDSLRAALPPAGW